MFELRTLMAVGLVSAVCSTGMVHANGDSASRLDLVLGAGGAFTVAVDGVAWLRSAPITVTAGGKNYTTMDGTLTPSPGAASHKTHTGSDAWGAFTSTVMAWKAGPTPFETEFRVYTSMGAIVFEQRFPEGASGTAHGGPQAEATLLSTFPTFNTSTAADEGGGGAGPQAYVHFAGDGVPTWTGCQMGPWPPSGEKTASGCMAGVCVCACCECVFGFGLGLGLALACVRTCMQV